MGDIDDANKTITDNKNLFEASMMSMMENKSLDKYLVLQCDLNGAGGVNAAVSITKEPHQSVVPEANHDVVNHKSHFDMETGKIDCLSCDNNNWAPYTGTSLMCNNCHHTNVGTLEECLSCEPAKRHIYCRECLFGRKAPLAVRQAFKKQQIADVYGRSESDSAQAAKEKAQWDHSVGFLCRNCYASDPSKKCLGTTWKGEYCVGPEMKKSQEDQPPKSSTTGHGADQPKPSAPPLHLMEPTHIRRRRLMDRLAVLQQRFN